MNVHYLAELDDERFALLPDKRVLIEREEFERIGDYTRSSPTGPSPGRVYRKNYGWPADIPDDWWLHVCERDPADPAYVLHHPYQVEIVETATA